MKLTPPADQQIESVTGLAIIDRTTIQLGHLSWVERLRVHQSDTGNTLVLKTVCRALAHERHVHAAVQDYSICAPKLLAADDASADHDAWILLSDVEKVTFDELRADEATQALVALAAVHQACLGRPDVTDIPRRDLSWLAEHSHETAEHLTFLIQRQGLDLGMASIPVYCEQLKMLAERHGAQELTVVHGDFDPGNVVCLSSGQFASLDWGLGHLNTPLVDFAHMAERFTRVEQDQIGAAFANAVGLPQRIDDLMLETGLIAHRAFFIWWHAMIVAEGWAPIDDFQHAIAQRVGFVTDRTE
jgi:hypothetical protein